MKGGWCNLSKLHALSLAIYHVNLIPTDRKVQIFFFFLFFILFSFLFFFLIYYKSCCDFKATSFRWSLLLLSKSFQSLNILFYGPTGTYFSGQRSENNMPMIFGHEISMLPSVFNMLHCLKMTDLSHDTLFENDRPIMFVHQIYMLASICIKHDTLLHCIRCHDLSDYVSWRPWIAVSYGQYILPHNVKSFAVNKLSYSLISCVTDECGSVAFSDCRLMSSNQRERERVAADWWK